MKAHLRVLVTLLGIAAFVAVAGAHWPASADTNLVICARTADQVEPKVVATSDGGCFVSWYDLSSGNYDIYCSDSTRTAWRSGQTAVFWWTAILRIHGSRTMI